MSSRTARRVAQLFSGDGAEGEFGFVAGEEFLGGEGFVEAPVGGGGAVVRRR